MLKPRYSRQFNKDIRRIEKSGDKDIEKLKTVLRLLIDQQPLERRYLDHPLSGNLRDYRDCHIEPDWLLIYRIDRAAQEITFIRTGSHADLFG